MDTSSPHAHPTTRRLSDPPIQQPTTRRRRPLNATSPAAFTPSPQHEGRVNPHQRRLQLRNSAFGTQLSAQTLGARFSRIFHGNEEPHSAPARDRQPENRTPHRGSLRSTRSNYSLNSSLGILNEISNSTLIPSLRKRASIPIYEENPERPLLEASPMTPDSQYHDASSTIQSPLSPLGLAYIQDDDSNMRLREVTGNERRRSTSLSSPLMAATDKGRRRATGTQKSSFEAAEYIDHIEKQLEQVKKSMHSPRSGKPIHEKMRLLKSENVRLRNAIDELESSFEARVKSSVEHMTAGEGELRRKIKCLEEDLRERDVRIEELAYEHDQTRLDQESLETLKATIEQLEAENQTLKDANSSIEKRNDILTEMLAFSPAKTSSGFELASPLRNKGRLPRPVSMMGSLTRFPSSPASRQASRPSSMVNSPAALSPGGYFSPRTVLELELEHPCNDANDADSGLGESCSAKSPIICSSRRSTLVSQASASPSAWGFPLPTSPVESGGTVRPIQKRKPRRFMTGSTQLKALLLPSMAAESAGITSPRSPNRVEIFEEPLSIDNTVFSHDLEGSLSSPKREISQQSIDPTTCFLSNPFGDVDLLEGTATTEPGSSPPHVSRPEDFSFSSVDSTSLATELVDITYLRDGLIGDIEDETGVEEEASCSFDSPERCTLFSPGQSQQPHPVFAEAQPVEDIRSSSATQDRLMSSIEALMRTSPPKQQPLETSPNPRKRRRTSSMPQSDAAILAPSVNLSSGVDRGSPVSRSILRPPESDFGQPSQQLDLSIAQFRPEINPITLAAQAAHRRSGSQSISPPKRSHNNTPLEILQRRSASWSPLAAVTIRSIYGTLSRYTTYIREFKRDPLALARRVIANAWWSNWTRFGKLSWWVLGIFLPGGRKDFAKAAGWNWENYDGEAVADRFCRPGTPREAVQKPQCPPRSSPRKRSVRFEDQHDSYRRRGSKTPAKAAPKDGKEKQTGLGKSLYLWGKFSVAIMLAVGGAMWKGPGEMLKDCDMRTRTQSNPRNSTGLAQDHHDTSQDGVSDMSSDFVEEEAALLMLPKHTPNISSWRKSFDFSKTARSPSSVFTFGSPDDDNFWKGVEDDDDPDQDLDHYHQPDYGETSDDQTDLRVSCSV